MRILLTGTTGYVGGRLLGRVEARGGEVRCLTRDPERMEGRMGRRTSAVRGGRVHGFVFAGMLRGIARAAEAEAGARPSPPDGTQHRPGGGVPR